MYLNKVKMPKGNKKDPIELFTDSRLSVFLQSSFYTVIMIAILAGGGYLLDQYFDTFPTLFIIGLAVGYPLTQIYIFRKFRKFGNKKLKNNK